jgi:hypothetical protein
VCVMVALDSSINVVIKRAYEQVERQSLPYLLLSSSHVIISLIYLWAYLTVLLLLADLHLSERES